MTKIIGIAFIGLLCYRLIVSTKPDIAPLVLVAIGATILILLSDTIGTIISSFGELTEKAGLNNTILASVLKIIGVGYITEYASSVCDDCSASSIAKKIQLSGKITIFIMALPIITGIVQTIESLL